MKALSLLLVCVSALVAPAAAHASSCTVQSIMGVAFGAYDVFATSPLDSTGSITFECTEVGEFDTVRIDLSAGSSGSFSPRTLTSGSALLAYNLFLDAARTVVWGDGTDGTSTYGPTTPEDGTSTTVNVYGRVPASQDASSGSYSDTVTVTVVF